MLPFIIRTNYYYYNVCITQEIECRAFVRETKCSTVCVKLNIRYTTRVNVNSKQVFSFTLIPLFLCADITIVFFLALVMFSDSSANYGSCFPYTKTEKQNMRKIVQALKALGAN